MCEICRQSPCDYRCPNAPEPPEIHHCKSCDEGICSGDEYAEIDGEYYHLDCLDDMSIKELMELCSIDCEVAEETGPDWDD